MSGSVTLNSAMRANLLSLQQTANLQATTQERLATGKKVNSALDNPTAFFAAQSLSGAASDLSNLLDGMGQAIQTITSATQGITAAESIVNQMQSVAQSAAQAVGIAGSGSGGTNIQAFAAKGTSGTGAYIVSGTNDGTVNLTSLVGTTAGGAANNLNILNGDQMTVQVGSGSTYTFTVGATNIDNSTVGNGGGSTLADLSTWLDTITGGANVSYSSTGNLILAAVGAGVTISGTLATDLSFTANASTAAVGSHALSTSSYSNLSAATGSTTLADLSNVTGGVLVSNTPDTGGTTVGNYLTLQVGGGQAQSINITAGMTVQNLLDDINSISGLSASLDSQGKLKVINNNSTSVTIGGTANGLLGAATSLAANTAETTTLYQGYGAVSVGSLIGTSLTNLQPPAGMNRLAAGDQLSLTVDGVTTSIAVTGAATNSSSQAGTVSGLLAALGQISGINASFDSTTGALDITNTGSAAVTIGGTAAAKLSLPTSVAAGGSSVSTSASTSAVAGYASQYDSLASQLNLLVGDTSYQGVNLINGTGTLKVLFDTAATNPSSLTVNSVDLTTSGLGLTAATNNWSSTAAVTSSQSQLTNAVSTLRSVSNSLGQNLTTVQTRQDFSTDMINTLQTGAGDLTNADMNTESANMLALQTQQQLGISSLSLASQAAQSILKLFP